MASQTVLSAAVEGLPDEAILWKICTVLGLHLGTVYGRTGKNFILNKLNAYNNSARFRHWVVLLDLDTDFPCAGLAIRTWLENPSPLMCLRVAVREIESWLLADSERIASFLRIRQSLVPRNPDDLDDPKLALINLARRSVSRAIREDMVPRDGAGQSEGPAYTSRIVQFARADSGWRPEIAAQFSPSLARCLVALRRFQ